MTPDPAENVGSHRETIQDTVDIEYTPRAGGRLHLVIYHRDERVYTAEHNIKIIRSETLRGQFINNVTATLEDVDTVDVGQLGKELREWFVSMDKLGNEEEADSLLPAHVQQIIDGTEHPVEIHGGETSTWNVELTYNGITRELEFTSAEMVNGGGGVLQEKIANYFFKIVEIQKEDWEAIRERWQQNSEVVAYVSETSEDAMVDRILEYLRHNVMPVAQDEKMANSPAAAWYDKTNEKNSSVVPGNEPVVWVQNNFLVDQIEAAGKSPEYKAQLIKKLNTRGDIYGIEGDGRKRWPNHEGAKRGRFYPFDPKALAVDEDDVGDVDADVHSEVDP